MEWLKYIYDKFLMRDLLGKITPGAIALYALARMAGLDDRADPTKWPGPVWLLGAAAALVTGLALQTLAEWMGIHSASPAPRRVVFFSIGGRCKKINDDFRTRLSMITQAPAEVWTPNSAAQTERYVYLKEGTGNLGAALLLCVAVLLVERNWTGSMVLAPFSILLIATHFIHGRRQAEHELTSLWRTANDDRVKDSLKAMADRINLRLS